MSMRGTKQATAKDYKDGRTKQSFKNETDINKLLQRAQKTGTISHLNKYEARYGDFSGFDFLESFQKLEAGRTIFAELPSEIRSEFNQNPAQFFDYVNDPANVDRLDTLLPGLAAPGRQNIDVNSNIPADVEKARVASEQPAPEVVSTTSGEPSGEPSPGPTPAEIAGSSDPT